MTSPFLAADARLSIYYFVQAMSVGAVNAFAGVWFAERGLSPAQIGIVAAAPVALVALIGAYFGRWADRAADWRDAIIAGAIASALFPVGLFFAVRFEAILIFWTAAVVAQMATLPILDAASVQYLRRQGGAFGVLYAWKTVGYMLAMLFAGLMLARFGPAVFPLVFSALCALRAAASLALPNLRRKGGPVSLARGSTGVSVYRSWLLAPLIGWSLVHATHFVLNGFLGLLWARESLSAPMIAAFIALSSVAEMAMFVAFRKLAARPPARLLIIASCVIGALRWCLLALDPPMWAIILAQLMHAGSYALGFIACTSFIAEHVDETRAAEAQSAFGAIQAAAATAGLLVFGALVEAFGASAFLFSAAVALLGALLAFVSRRWLSVRAH